MSFASCQFGENRCTNCASSSKQNKKKRCGYQCRQKCQNFCDAVKSACFRDSVCASMRFGFRADLASIVKSSKIIIATSACSPPRRPQVPIAGTLQFQRDSKHPRLVYRSLQLLRHSARLRLDSLDTLVFLPGSSDALRLRSCDSLAFFQLCSSNGVLLDFMGPA